MSERRKYLVLVGIIVAALVGVGFMAIPGSPGHRKPTLGLDLQGGLEVVLQAQPPKGTQLTSQMMDSSLSIMRDRVDRLGVSEPEIRKQGSNQIVIQLPGVHNAATAAAIIGKTAQLQFYDMAVDVAGPTAGANFQVIPSSSLYNLLSGAQSTVNKHSIAWYLFNKQKKPTGPSRASPVASPTASPVAIPTQTRAALLANHKGKLPKGDTIFGVPPNRTVITCGPPATACPGVQAATPQGTFYYLFKLSNNKSHPIPEMTGKDLKSSGTRADFDPQTNQPIVVMSFTGQGQKIFQQITAKEAQRGQLLNSPNGPASAFAIVLDNQVESFPSTDYTKYPNGISGSNGAEITGVTYNEAKQIALVLQTGALPVKFATKSRTDVSATLGKDSLTQAKLAAAIGLIVVALFLLLFYRFLGLVAVIGLGVYAAFLYAAILLFHVVLTLPGFAGMILTIGVAADANVVIFERIKEEVRSGKSVRAAIATGYTKGFATIVDANVVTAITALILFGVATAEVKGFALMLLIGTIISLVTAVAATRALLGLLAGFRWFDNPTFMGAAGAQRWKWLQIDFMGKRNWWFAISGAIILIGAVSLGVRGLNFGIDFKGGTQMTFSTPKAVAISSVRTQTSKVGQSDAVIQGTGKSINGDYKGFQVRMRSLKTGVQNRLTTNLKNAFGAQIRQVTNISSSFGRQIANAAVLAIIVSLLLIILYIWIRFQFSFALPVIAALVHDIIITVGVYSLTGREVSTATVAAVLTVLGYSIYDTIIIFHRIKENIPLMRRASFATITNVSLWETIRRSLATSFITLLPVGALFLFGGATLKDFAFALLVGITSGAYSSIFIAAPLLTLWKEREPEYARRRGSDAIEAGIGAIVPEPVETSTDGDVAEAEPEEAELVPAAPPADSAKAGARRERRRQRRRTRPHGRAR